MRAMLLRELLNIPETIETMCVEENWTDMLKGQVLTPDEVNLYHFNYHLISPKTCSASITLFGLQDGHYQKGGRMKQVDSNGVAIARGVVLEDVTGTDVQVKLTKGQFQTASSLTAGGAQVVLQKVHRGVPNRIENADSCSYKEMISSTPTPPTWFCTHWWGEPIFDFVKCCREHAKFRGLEDTKASYWICAYANRQSQEELDYEVGEDPDTSSFRRAMLLSEGTLLMLDRNATPFERIWCDYELYKVVTDDVLLDIAAVEEGRVRLLTKRPLPHEHLVEKSNRERKFPVTLLAKGIQVKLQEGRCTVEEDKVRILNSMGKNPKTGVVDPDLLAKNVEDANRALRGYLASAAWPQAVRMGVVQSFGVAALCLPEILVEDVIRTSLELSFSGLREVSDSEVASIAQGLPRGLQSLSLSFESCVSITDIGVVVLAQRVALLQLHSLQLDFLGCARLTDAALTSLASLLPDSLKEVRLDFSLCTNLTLEGVRALARDLPASVTKLTATFAGTECGKTFESVRQLKATLNAGFVTRLGKTVLGGSRERRGAS